MLDRQLTGFQNLQELLTEQEFKAIQEAGVLSRLSEEAQFVLLHRLLISHQEINQWLLAHAAAETEPPFFSFLQSLQLNPNVSVSLAWLSESPEQFQIEYQIEPLYPCNLWVVLVFERKFIEASFLLRLGVDPYAELNENHWNIAHIAAYRNDADIIAYLDSVDFDFTHATPQGNILHIAGQQCAQETLQILLPKHRGLLREKNRVDQVTPLVYTARVGYVNAADNGDAVRFHCIKLLAESWPITPEDIATKDEFLEQIVALLTNVNLLTADLIHLYMGMVIKTYFVVPPAPLTTFSLSEIVEEKRGLCVCALLTRVIFTTVQDLKRLVLHQKTTVVLHLFDTKTFNTFFPVVLPLIASEKAANFLKNFIPLLEIHQIFQSSPDLIKMILDFVEKDRLSLRQKLVILNALFVKLYPCAYPSRAQKVGLLLTVGSVLGVDSKVTMPMVKSVVKTLSEKAKTLVWSSRVNTEDINHDIVILSPLAHVGDGLLSFIFQRVGGKTNRSRATTEFAKEQKFLGVGQGQEQ